MCPWVEVEDFGVVPLVEIEVFGVWDFDIDVGGAILGYPIWVIMELNTHGCIGTVVGSR